MLTAPNDSLLSCPGSLFVLGLPLKSALYLTHPIHVYSIVLLFHSTHHYCYIVHYYYRIFPSLSHI